MRKDLIGKRVLFIFLLFLQPACIATQQDILALNRQIRTLNKELEDIKSVREKQAEAGAEIDSVRQELLRISGNQEENKHLIQHIIERDTSEQGVQNARLTKLEKTVVRLNNYLHLEPPENQIKPNETEGLLTPTPPKKEENSDSPENSLYEITLSAYHEEKYEEAIAGFEDFLKSYPTSELADNAQFWIGESYMARKKYDQAIVAFQDVIEKYPTGNKVPNALLKQALAFYEIKDTISSRAILKKILKNYPDSNEAKIAKAKLETIN